MLLKNFCDSDGLFWVWDGAKVYSATPANAFVIKHLYTKQDFTNATTDAGHQSLLDSIEKSYEYEEQLGKLENQAEPVVQQIVERARNRELPQLSGESRDSFKRFVFAMARRTPESQDRVAVLNDPEDAFYEAAKATAKAHGYQWQSKEDLYQDPRVRDLKDIVVSNGNARFSAGDHPDLKREERRFMEDVGLRVAATAMPEYSFLIGSHGLAIIEDGSVLSGSWLPIAPDVAVGLTSFQDSDVFVALDDSNDCRQIVSAINEATTAMSKVIAGQSESLVRSVTHKRYTATPPRKLQVETNLNPWI